MITFLSRFIPNVSALLEPLRVLIKKDVHFHWTSDHTIILDKVKSAVASSETLSYFDKTKKTVIQTDASLKGLGACLMQDGKPIAFASKSLSKSESNYSNIEREMLGVVFALVRFHQYSYGRKVTVISDHKPLESIYKKPLGDAPPRLQRMLLKIQQYDYEIIYSPGSHIPVPDCLSRLIDTHRVDPEVTDMKINVHEVVLTGKSKLQVIRDQLKLDESMCKLRDYIIFGWPESRSTIEVDVLPYWSFREELGFYQGLILKGSRIVIPQSLIPDVLKDIHRGHLGIEKCRLRARDCVYWTSMNADISRVVNQCPECQTYALPQSNEYNLSIQKRCYYPLQVIGMDLFEYRGNNYLLLADYYSSFPWIRKLSSISSSKVIEACRTIFTEYGYPTAIHTDSGSQFMSSDFKKFVADHNVNHTASSPFYHQSNGKAERFVQTIKQLLRKSNAECTVGEAMLIYRSTPLSSGRRSPGELMFNRRLATNLVSAKLTAHDDPEDHQTEKPSRFPVFYKDDIVLVYNTFSKVWEKGRIISMTNQPNQYHVTLQNGKMYVRNHIHLKHDRTIVGDPPPQDTQAAPPILDAQLADADAPMATTDVPIPVVPLADVPDVTDNTEQIPNTPDREVYDEPIEVPVQQHAQHETAAATPLVAPDQSTVRRSKRVTKHPSRYKDYVT